MSYSIEILHKQKIIKYKHTGLIRKDDIGKAWDEFLQLKEFTQLKYNLLSDYSEGQFIGSEDDIKDILKILLSLKGILEGKKQAIIINEPQSTAMSLIFGEKVIKEVGFKVKVFYTKNAALGWLLF